MPQRYTIAVDNIVTMKEVGVAHIVVGEFTKSADFSDHCRGAGSIAPPDNVTISEYIRKAFVDELKMAALLSRGEQADKITLTGTIDHLSFSSIKYLNRGYWKIGLQVRSSNGKSHHVMESYEFNSGFSALTACIQTAQALLPATQNLIGKLVKSPEFRELVTP